MKKRRRLYEHLRYRTQTERCKSLQRRIVIPGAFHVRGLGGLPTTDGRTTRWARFVRSDLLSGLPDDARETLSAYGVRTFVDLRTTEETIQSPCSLAEDTRFEVHHCNLEGDESILGFLPSLNSRKMANSYAALLAVRRSAVRDVFATLAGSNRSPIPFFCAGGTDRTGMIAALILGLSGVPDETIAADCSLSAQGLVDNFLSYGAPPWMPLRDIAPGRALATLARRDTMLYLLRRLRQDYGSVASYFKSVGVAVGEIDECRDSFN